MIPPAPVPDPTQPASLVSLAESTRSSYTYLVPFDELLAVLQRLWHLNAAHLNVQTIAGPRTGRHSAAAARRGRPRVARVPWTRRAWSACRCGLPAATLRYSTTSSSSSHIASTAVTGHCVAANGCFHVICAGFPRTDALYVDTLFVCCPGSQ